MKAKKPKTDKAKAKNKLDEACKKYIKARDGHKCVICGAEYTISPKGRKAGVHWGHFLAKNRLAMRWNEINIHAQCSRCNFMHESSCVPYYQWMEERYGVRVMDILHEQWFNSKGTSFSIKEIEVMTLHYKVKLAKLKEVL